jgi:hypothetical protein
MEHFGRKSTKKIDAELLLWSEVDERPPSKRRIWERPPTVMKKRKTMKKIRC